MANGETNSILPPDGHAGTNPRCMCTAMSCNRLFIHKGGEMYYRDDMLLTMPTAEELLVRLEMGTSMPLVCVLNALPTPASPMFFSLGL